MILQKRTPNANVTWTRRTKRKMSQKRSYDEMEAPVAPVVPEASLPLLLCLCCSFPSLSLSISQKPRLTLLSSVPVATDLAEAPLPLLRCLLGSPAPRVARPARLWTYVQHYTL